VSFPTIAYRVWAIFSPLKRPPCCFVAMASSAYALRARAQAEADRRSNEERATRAIDPATAATAAKFGATLYEVRTEPVVAGAGVICGTDTEMTPYPEGIK
jgi:hypothetical protein